MSLGQKAYPHLSGIGASKASIKEILSDYKEQGLTSIVTLRGDLPSGIGGLGDFPYALDLIKFIKKEEENFSIEISAYPEVHPDAESENADFENSIKQLLLPQKYKKNPAELRLHAFKLSYIILLQLHPQF